MADAFEAPPRPKIEQTDIGRARLLVMHHGSEIRWFGGAKSWLIWDGTRWATDETQEIERRAKDVVERMFAAASKEPDEDKRKKLRNQAMQASSRHALSSMIALAQSEPGIAVTADDLDSDPWLLNTQSGVLDLRSGAVAKPDARNLITKTAATKYVKDARSDLWDRFVADLFGDDHDLRDYVQRALGYALFGAWREKAFWFGYGPPDGGKSTFLGVVSDVLGDYAVSADASTWMLQQTGGNRGDIVRLRGARLVTTSEVRASARFDQQIMKAVTGGDRMTAAAKYASEISFLASFALWFAANDRPIIPDDDEGFWARVRCVPFTRVVPPEKQDKALREKLTSPEHAPAVLRWLVDGCLEWQRSGIGSCQAVEDATQLYRRDNNAASGFFDECLEIDPNGVAFAREVWQAYQGWAHANGVRNPLTGKSLGARLRQLGVTGNDDASRRNGLPRWFGVKLRNAPEPFE